MTTSPTNQDRSNRGARPRPARYGLRLILLLALMAAVAVFLARHWFAMNRGIFLFERGRYEEALVQLRTVEPHIRSFTPVYYELKTLMKLNRPREAMALLKRVRRARPEEAVVHQSLGLLALRQGQWDTAVAAFDRSRQLLEHQGDPFLGPKALSIARAVGALADNDPHAALAQLGEPPPLDDNRSAEAEVEEGADVFWLLRGLAHYKLGQWEVAYQEMDQSLAIRPDNSLASIIMAIIDSSRGDWHQARYHFNVAEQVAPDTAVPMLMREVLALLDQATGKIDLPMGPLLTRDNALTWLVTLWADAGIWDPVFAYLQGALTRQTPEKAQLWWAFVRALKGKAHYKTADWALGRFRYCFGNAWPLATPCQRRPVAGWPVPVIDDSWASPEEWAEIPLPKQLPRGAALVRGEVVLHSDTSLQLPVQVKQSGRWILVLEARGSPSGKIWPWVKVGVEPAQMEGIYINSRKPHLYAFVVYLEQGTNDLTVSYTNDTERVVLGEDRNAHLRRCFISRTPLIPQPREEVKLR